MQHLPMVITYVEDSEIPLKFLHESQNHQKAIDTSKVVSTRLEFFVGVFILRLSSLPKLLNKGMSKG